MFSRVLFLVAAAATVEPTPAQVYPAFQPTEFSFDMSSFVPAGLSETSIGCPPATRNPFLHFRLTAKVKPPNSNGSPGTVVAGEIAGFYAGGPTDYCTGDVGPGSQWNLRFAPDHRAGVWTLDVIFENGNGLGGLGFGSDGQPINVSDQAVGTSNVLWQQSIQLTTTKYDPTADGFYGRGFLRTSPDDGITDSWYYAFVNPDLTPKAKYFLKTGVNSPENWFGYQQFYKSEKNPAVMTPIPCTTTPPAAAIETHGVWHLFDASPPAGNSPGRHGLNDWVLGDPEWVTTRSELVADMSQPSGWRRDLTYFNAGAPCGPSQGLAGHGIIGALKYLSNQGMNSIYVIPMNLGGDGRDTHPFASVDPRDFLHYTFGGNTPFQPEDQFHYSIRRMQEWNIVVGYAMERGIMVHFLLHEQEFPNLNWLAYDYTQSSPCTPTFMAPWAPFWLGRGLTTARRLYIKQMVAHFGHHPAIQWNLCEEESHTGTHIDFSVPQLNAMAGWIRRWDSYYLHPITVHPDGNDRTVYSAILNTGAAGDWLDAISYYAHADESGVQGNTNNPFAASEPYRYDEGVEVLRTTLGNPPFNRKAVISVDEQGHHFLAASGRDTDAPWDYVSELASPAGRRRLALYDILFSGGNLEWYGGYGMQMDGYDACGIPLMAGTNHGGGDLTIEEFRSREELWAQTAIARRFITNFAYWDADPNDTARIVGEKNDAPSQPPYGAFWGQAQVLERVTTAGSPDQTFHLVYYPDVINPSDLGSIDLTYAGVGTNFTFRFFSPVTGLPVTPALYPSGAGGGTLNLASALFPGGAGWPTNTLDLVMIVVRL